MAPYIVAQLVGAVLAGGVLLLIANGLDGFEADTGLPGAFASNGYGDFSPGGYSLLACFVCEVVMTAFFLLIIMGATHGQAPVGFAPVAIGLALTLIHLISIPVTNTSVNPARSFGVAVFAGSDALEQLWLFIVAPIIGAVIGAFIYARVLLPDVLEPDIEGGADADGRLTVVPSAGRGLPSAAPVSCQRVGRSDGVGAPSRRCGCAARRRTSVIQSLPSPIFPVRALPRGRR